MNGRLPTQIIKRNGATVPFDLSRVERAVTLCYSSFDEDDHRPSTPVVNLVNAIGNAISAKYGEQDEIPTVESVQDIVEMMLQAAGEYEAAKRYIIYRSEHARQRVIIPAEVQEAFDIDAAYFPSEMQRFMFYDKYSRFNWDWMRRETWPETVDRAVNFLIKLSGGNLDLSVYERIRNSILRMEAMPSMRLLAMAGPAAERNSMSIYNCSYLPLDSIDSLVEIMLISLAGCGVGYSVERRYVEEFPRVLRQKKDDQFLRCVVEDSAEGWAESLRVGLAAWIRGNDIEFDYSLVRPAGLPLKTKGGRASGPGPLKEVHRFCRAMILSRQGRFLSTVDVHDMACVIGGAAVSGGVRRTALIALFDYDDTDMRTCKSGAKLDQNPHRWNANNSAVWPDEISQLELVKQFTEMDESQRGEPGIFSRHNANHTKPNRRKKAAFGSNPCLPEFAPVLTKHGISPLSEINAGSVIWTETGWARVLKKWFSGNKAVYRYRTTAGVFYGTQDHKIVSNGTKIKVGKAESIDVLVGPDWQVEIDPQDVMDGFVIGDGSVHRASNDLVFAYIGKDDQDLFDSEIKKLIIQHRPGLKNTAWEVSTTIKAHELPMTYEREVPERFFYGTPDSMAGFLRGLYTANGSVVDNRVTLKAASRKLVEQVQVMLSALGIRSYHTTNRVHDVQFDNGTYECRESYDINITVDRDRFAELIGFLQPYKNDKLCSTGASPRKTAYDIVEVDLIGYMDVYDIMVDNKPHTFWNNGVNVSNCGEINLRPMEFCNLTIAVARANDTFETLRDKVEVATIIGTIQSLATDFPGMREDWKRNCEEERLLGVDINGERDCALINEPGAVTEAIFNSLRTHAIAINRRYANMLGINPSAAITCNKPNGNSSQLLDCSSGINDRFAPYYIRNVRVNTYTPVFRVLQASGVPMSPENGQTAETANTWVVHFPMKAPEGSKTRRDHTAIDQCEFWLANKKFWTEHNPSITVNYHPHELLPLMAWVWTHREEVGGMAFLPIDDAQYEQMPYEEITQEEYEKKIADFPPINWALLYAYEHSDMTTAAQELACMSGACEIV